MRFNCHACKTKYDISDEKVRNKILKIRCKKCQATITIHDPSIPESALIATQTKGLGNPPPVHAPVAAALPKPPPIPPPMSQSLGMAVSTSSAPLMAAALPKPPMVPAPMAAALTTPPMVPAPVAAALTTPPMVPAPVAAALPKPPPAASAFSERKPSQPQADDSAKQGEKVTPSKNKWHIVSKGTQRGPLELAHVFRLIQAGDVTDDAYVWKKGFPKWIKIVHVPELNAELMKHGLPVKTEKAATPTETSAPIQRDVAHGKSKPAILKPDPAESLIPDEGSRPKLIQMRAESEAENQIAEDFVDLDFEQWSEGSSAEMSFFSSTTSEPLFEAENVLGREAFAGSPEDDLLSDDEKPMAEKIRADMALEFSIMQRMAKSSKRIKIFSTIGGISILGVILFAVFYKPAANRPADEESTLVKREEIAYRYVTQSSTKEDDDHEIVISPLVEVKPGKEEPTDEAIAVLKEEPVVDRKEKTKNKGNSNLSHIIPRLDQNDQNGDKYKDAFQDATPIEKSNKESLLTQTERITNLKDEYIVDREKLSKDMGLKTVPLKGVSTKVDEEAKVTFNPSQTNDSNAVAFQLNGDQIREVISKKKTYFKRCTKYGDLHGPTKVKVSFFITPTGKVSDAGVLNEDLLGSQLAECVARIINSLTFPASAQGQTVKTSFLLQ